MVARSYESNGKGSSLRGPGTGKSDSINARLSHGESIINAQSTSWFKPLLSAINVAGGGVPFDNSVQITPWGKPGFASGGVVSTYLPTSDNGLRNKMSAGFGGNGRMHTDDMNALISGISSTMMDSIKSIPIPNVDVKDVNRQQGMLSQVLNRSSR